MTDPLDRIEIPETKLADPWKVLNTVLIFLPFVIILYTIWSVWNTKQHLSSPWLPEYTAYFINGTLINLSIILSGSILPALIFRWRRYYVSSSACVLLFAILGAIVKYDMNFYPHVFAFFS